LNYLESIKENQETYWYEYRKLQDWLQEQQLSTSFIRWVERRMKKFLWKYPLYHHDENVFNK
ncbi:hypothetical protein ACX16R_29730, partial [Bacillus cereus]